MSFAYTGARENLLSESPILSKVRFMREKVLETKGGHKEELGQLLDFLYMSLRPFLLTDGHS